MNKKENHGTNSFKNKIELLINEILFLRKENELLREQLEFYKSRFENPGKYFDLLKPGSDVFIKSIPAGKAEDLKNIRNEDELNSSINPEFKITAQHSGKQNSEDKIEDALISNADFDIPDEADTAINAEKELYSTKVSHDKDILRNMIDEKLRLSLRKKFNKNIRNRWINELLYFQSKSRVKTENMLQDLDIPVTTLKRDIKLFKSKNWIEYTGTRKHGFYRITIEGRSILEKENSQ